MSFKFSKLGEFFLKNWQTYEELTRSEKRIRKEFNDYLFSLEGILKKKAWWTRNMEFVAEDAESVYISRRDWGDDEGYVIWIGVEGFTPENLLSGPKRAECFLYVPGKKRARVKIREDLRKKCEASGRFKSALELAENFTEYVLVKELRTYSPETLFKGARNSDPLTEVTKFIESVYNIIRPYKIK